MFVSGRPPNPASEVLVAFSAKLLYAVPLRVIALAIQSGWADVPSEPVELAFLPK